MKIEPEKLNNVLHHNAVHIAYYNASWCMSVKLSQKPNSHTHDSTVQTNNISNDWKLNYDAQCCIKYNGTNRL